MIGAWPLVGRRSELELIVRTVSDRRARGLVLAGAAGTGKSRLIARALADIDPARYRVLSAAATQSARPIPFGALAHLLPVDLSLTGRRANLLHSGARAICAENGRRRVVMFVDDAHDLDGHSAALIHHLVHSNAVFVLLTVRPDSHTPDSVTALWKNGLTPYVRIFEFTRDEVGELLANVLHVDPPRGVLDRVWGLTTGNALKVHEVVLAALEIGVLREEEGSWRWRGSVGRARRVVELIMPCLTGVSRSERAALEAIALGEPIGARLVEKVAGEEALDRLERRKLIRAWRTGQRVDLGIADPLIGEALRAMTSARRARAIRSGLAATLQASGVQRSSDLLRLAAWRIAAGEDMAVGLRTQAARSALAALDCPLAERLAAGAGDGSAELTLILAHALIGQGRFRDANEVLARQPGHALLAATRARNLLWRLRDVRLAAQVLSAAEDQADAPRRVGLLLVRVELMLFRGHTEAARTAAIELLKHPDVTDHEVALAAQTACEATLLSGCTRQARELARIGMAAAERAVPQLPFSQLTLRGKVYLADLAEGRIAATRNAVLAEYNRAARADWLRGIWALELALIHRLMGDMPQALSWAREAAPMLREADTCHRLPQCLGEIAYSAALLGDTDAADRALIDAETTRNPAYRIDLYSLGSARAWILWARGEFAAATASAMDTAAQTQAMGQKVLAAAAWHDLVRLGNPRLAAEPLRELATAIEGPLTSAYASHAAALAAGDGAALDQVARVFAELGTLLYAAETAAEAVRAHQRSGRLGSALAAKKRSCEWAARCGPICTPALRSLNLPEILTMRQQEIVLLATRNLTSREIAERLVLSERTVENHLHRIYTRLGINSRAQLEDVLTPTSDRC